MKLIYTSKKLLITLAIAIFTIQANAQILCGLGSRNIIHETSANREYSGLAYHTERDIFFMPVDAPINISNNFEYIVSYDQNGNISYATFSNLSELNDNDLEGLTYLEQDYFILVEEDRNDVYFLEYHNGNKTFEILSRHDTGISLGLTSDGLEGISYDPHTGMLFLVREHYEVELFSIPVSLPNTNSDGSINIAQKKSVVLPSTIFSDNDSETDNDASGLFHLGKIVDSSSHLSNNLLILSEGLKKVVEFDVSLDVDNNLLVNKIGEHPLPFENQPEGITVHDGKIYITSEVGQDSFATPATLSSYALPYDILSCKIIDANCNCLDQPGCIDSSACNYNANATEDDGSCNYSQPNFDCNGNCTTIVDCEGICNGSTTVGTSCNDNNANTVNDQYDENCNCTGDTFPGCTDASACNYDADATVEDGSCKVLDCENTCGGSALANTVCNDNNANTINDRYDENCNCAGETFPGCTDANACNYDAGATIDDGSCKVLDCENTCGGSALVDAVCNDNNTNTINDRYDENCNCIGEDNCPTDIIHNGNLTGGIYTVSNSIESTATINQSQRVDYDAGGYIHLDKGFLADSKNSVYLLAKIDGCIQLRKGNYIEQIASIKNYPNPFTGETTIVFEVNEQSNVSLMVTDIMGKVVAILLSDTPTENGTHQLRFDGNHLAQGVYYCTLITNDNISTQKMMLMK